LQDVEDSRGVRRWRGLGRVSPRVRVVGSESEGSVLVVEEGEVELEEGSAAGGGGGGGGGGGLLVSCCGPRGMMVLFWKQVHLQKDGTAGMCVSPRFLS
jgi:hypothetical protein